MRVTIQILDAALETLETRNSRSHSLGSHAEGCVANLNYAHNSNVLYPSKIMSKFTMIFHFCLPKAIYCKWKCIHDLLFVCGVCPKGCTKLSKFYIREPLVY